MILVKTNKRIHTKRGFSILETVVAIAILAASVAAPIALASFSIQAIAPARNKLMALHMMQEGYELVRNMRDNNVHSFNDFDQGFCATYPCFFEIACDYSATPPDRCWNVEVTPYASPGRLLKISNDGFVNYQAGNDTIFRRRIWMDEFPGLLPGTRELRYTVRVSWQERGRDSFVRATGVLTDWR